MILIFYLVILSISCFLQRLIDYHSSTKGVFKVMSRKNTRCIGVDCNVLWYVLRTEKTVATSIPDQGSSLSSSLFFKSSVRTRFAMTL